MKPSLLALSSRLQSHDTRHIYPMKLLIFAHVPPPHHGQAVMVQHLLEGLREHSEFEVFHVNARVSNDMEDIGGFRWEKLQRLLGFCWKAIQIRFRHGPMDWYYVPAPAKKSAILRDWVVMLLVRPWFHRTIFHWHAFGLGHWVMGTTEYPEGRAEVLKTGSRKQLEDNKKYEEELERGAPLFPPVLFGKLEGVARWLTRRLFDKADLSIVLTNYNRQDAAFLRPKKIVVVPNGIPDPCPDFTETVLPQKQARAAAGLPLPLRLLFLGHCMESKGLLTAVQILAEYRAKTDRSAQLTVAGKFPSLEERAKFDALIAELALEEVVHYVGFADAEAKRALFLQSDLLLFPTKYPTETFGLVLVESLAFGMPAHVSYWRGVQELLPSYKTGVAETLPSNSVVQMTFDGFDPETMRHHFLRNYSLAAFLGRIANCLR